ncbi:uncharacterized protein LOC136080598 [Hydra vulgaris]|uniref:Uncharacterized protein LOC136080598 n=1 Tax=Hydra vulgaris TaxID=6087 RepID=A0ABM4BWG6_HYDVU
MMKSIAVLVVSVLLFQCVSAKSLSVKLPTKCEDVLTADTCASLKTAAAKLKVNTQLVNDAVINAVKNNIQNTQEIILFVKDTLVEKATNFQCTGVLSAEQCNKIGSIGKNLKLKASDVSKAIKEAVVNGVDQAKVIYARAVGFLLNNVKNVNCETLVSAEVCKKVADYAKSLKLSATDATNAIKEAIVQGANNAVDYFNNAAEYLRAQISCENVLSADTCEKVKKIADKFSVSLTEVNSVIRSAVASGVTKVKDLYKQAVNFIVEKWTQSFGDEPSMYKRNIDQEEVKEKVVRAVEMLMGIITKYM